MPETKTLAEALVAFQADAPKIALDGENPHFKSKFPSLAGVMDTIRPVLNKHGLTVIQLPTTIGYHATIAEPGFQTGAPALRTILMHSSGEKLEDTMLLCMDRQGPQAQGAALTYARRYAVLGLLGLVGDEDDDGNTASAPKEPAKAKPKFVAPTNGKPDEEAVKLAAELLELVGRIGEGNGTKAELVPATQTLIGQHAGDKAWLKRQIAAAQKNLADAVPFS